MMGLISHDLIWLVLRAMGLCAGGELALHGNRPRWEAHFHQKGARLNARPAFWHVCSFPLSGSSIRTQKGVKTHREKNFNSPGRHQKAVTGEIAAPNLVKTEKFSSRRRPIRAA